MLVGRRKGVASHSPGLSPLLSQHSTHVIALCNMKIRWRCVMTLALSLALPTAVAGKPFVPADDGTGTRAPAVSQYATVSRAQAAAGSGGRRSLPRRRGHVACQCVLPDLAHRRRPALPRLRAGGAHRRGGTTLRHRPPCSSCARRFFRAITNSNAHSSTCRKPSHGTRAMRVRCSCVQAC